MSTSQHAFDQVRSILGKLDRSIDAAREKRLQTNLPVAPQLMPAPQPILAMNPGAPDPGRSGYGRARPMRS